MSEVTEDLIPQKLLWVIKTANRVGSVYIIFIEIYGCVC